MTVTRIDSPQLESGSTTARNNGLYAGSDSESSTSSPDYVRRISRALTTITLILLIYLLYLG